MCWLLRAIVDHERISGITAWWFSLIRWSLSCLQTVGESRPSHSPWCGSACVSNIIMYLYICAHTWTNMHACTYMQTHVGQKHACMCTVIYTYTIKTRQPHLPIKHLINVLPLMPTLIVHWSHVLAWLTYVLWQGCSPSPLALFLSLPLLLPSPPLTCPIRCELQLHGLVWEYVPFTFWVCFWQVVIIFIPQFHLGLCTFNGDIRVCGVPWNFGIHFGQKDMELQKTIMKREVLENRARGIKEIPSENNA